MFLLRAPSWDYILAGGSEGLLSLCCFDILKFFSCLPCLLILANVGCKTEREVNGRRVQYALLFLCVCLDSIQHLKEELYQAGVFTHKSSVYFDF